MSESIRVPQITMAYSDQLARILADRVTSWDQLLDEEKNNIMRKYQEKFHSTAQHEGDHLAFPNENEINQFLNEENIGNKVEIKGQELVNVKKVNKLLGKKVTFDKGVKKAGRRRTRRRRKRKRTKKKRKTKRTKKKRRRRRN